MTPPIDPNFLFRLEQAPDGMVIADEQGQWVWVNTPAADLCGRPRPELIGQTGAEILPGWPPQSTPSLLQTLCPRPDGTIKSLTIEYVTLEIAPGYHLFSLYESPPHATSEIYYRTLFNLLPVGVSITDKEGNLIEANPASAEILGISPRQHCQRKIDSQAWQIQRADGSPMPPSEYASVQALQSQRPVTGQIQRVVRPDGILRFITVNAAPLPVEHGVVITYIDITEQKQAEAAQHRTEQQLQHIANLSPAVIYSVIETTDGPIRYEYLSQRFAELHEISQSQAYANPRLVYDQLHPEDRPRYQRIIAEAIHHWQPFECEWRIITPGGRVKWLRGQSYPERLENGEIRWSGVALDITQQKQLEHTLERKIAQEETLTQVVQAIHSSLDLTEIFTIAATTASQRFNLEVGIVQYLLEKACWRYQIRCLQNGELAATNMEIPDEDNPFAQQLKNQQIVQVDDSTTITDTINQKIAEQFPGAWLIIPLLVNGTVWGALCCQRPQDFTPWQSDEISLAQRMSEQLGIAIERAEMHQQLQASQRELRFLVDNCPASIIYWELLPDYQLKYKYISPSDEQIVGYPARSFLNNPALWQAQIVSEDWQNIVAPALQSIYQGANQVSVEYRFNHPEGRIVWVHNTMAVQWRNSPTSISLISVGIDITDLKSAQIQIAELARLNRLKDDFVSTVSHELRTPLTNIQMATKMLELTLKRQGLLSDAGASPLSKYLHILQEQTQREIRLVNDLLDLARLESGSRCPTCSPIDLKTYLPPLLEPFQERMTQQQQRLCVELPDDLPLGLGYTPYLERIINELLGNACKYTPAGEKIILSAADADDQVLVQVTNTGIEIPAGEQTRIFEKFYRIPQHDPWQHGGTGLGLALVKELAERMGGGIDLVSTAGQTRFTLSLRRVW